MGETVRADRVRSGRRPRAAPPASAGRRLALLVLLLTVGVVGMHQMSEGHALVTPETNAHQTRSMPALGQMASVADDDAHHLGTATDSGRQLLQTARDCGDCGWHSMIAVCLVALILLQALAPRLRPRLSRAMTVAWTTPVPVARRRATPVRPEVLCVSRT